MLISGRFEEILQVFSKVVSEFIFILLRVVRLVEVLFLVKHHTLASDRAKMMAVYLYEDTGANLALGPLIDGIFTNWESFKMYNLTLEEQKN